MGSPKRASRPIFHLLGRHLHFYLRHRLHVLRQRDPTRIRLESTLRTRRSVDHCHTARWSSVECRDVFGDQGGKARVERTEGEEGVGG